MYWDAYLYITLFLLIGINLIGIYIRSRRKQYSRYTRPVSFLFISVAVAGFVWVLPFRTLATGSLIEAFVISFQSLFQMFSLDGDYLGIRDIINCSTSALNTVYRWLGACLYVLAPVMTISVILSFIRDLNSRISILFSSNRTLYIFSELNDESITLARSCIEHDVKSGQKSRVIFTDVFPASDETSAELQETALSLGAICISTDITASLFKRRSATNSILFFILGSDEAEKIKQTITLVSRHHDDDRVKLYLFASTQESALLSSSFMDSTLKMTVRRVNTIQSLVYTNLFETNLSKNAILLPSGEKEICAAIVGFGQYGEEFLKALTWCGQIPGHRIVLHVFDNSPLAESKFTAKCPELMAMNHNQIEGECHYDIFFHRTDSTHGIDVTSFEFAKQLTSLGKISHVFVALGSDASSIEVAAQIRILLCRSQPDHAPVINAVVYQSEKAEAASKAPIRGSWGDSYDINIIGSLAETYSYDTILNSELEDLAKERHLKWSSKENRIEETFKFYCYEYYYRSSIASVIRHRIREQAGVPGITKAPSERTTEERIAIQKVEHAGWNAYMRTEGFCFAPVRNNLAKQHHLLIPFNQLPRSEQDKDDD